jgi:hypothetical protein
MAGSLTGTSSRAAQRRASMPLLPVTKIWSAGTASRTMFSWFLAVGARWNEAMRVISWRFSSSGKGEKLWPPVRRPASTWITGMRRWDEASAAASSEVVSPWTSAATGH